MIKTTCIINLCLSPLSTILYPSLSMLHDDKLYIKQQLCLSCGHSGHLSVFKYSKEKEKRSRNCARKFQFCFLCVINKLDPCFALFARCRCCIWADGRTNGQRDKERVLLFGVLHKFAPSYTPFHTVACNG